ncbi:unnamed protein product [Cuscuta campestris]|uniref:Uncharacterized protein n=1 Tax=Cuscuta campestris TaxID=132261 RepID=A0A484NB77_9ASTE|nr:unnamed protein product [Cuscuta campestris]
MLDLIEKQRCLGGVAGSDVAASGNGATAGVEPPGSCVKGKRSGFIMAAGINLGFLLGRNWQLQLESARVFASTIPCLPPIATDLESSTLAEGSFERCANECEWSIEISIVLVVA